VSAAALGTASDALAFGSAGGTAAQGLTSRVLSALVPEIGGMEGRREIAGIASDSRKVVPGGLFIAIPGTKADGAAFIADAVARGAAAILGEGTRPAGLPEGVAYAQVANARLALAAAAPRFYPAQPAHVVGITGTSGKSSVADFTRQLLAGLGRASASLGTLGVVKADGAAYGSLTTPDPITLHATLDQLAREGVSDLAMEASSHGLEQHRLDGVRLSAAAFTNLGRDHLDYHPTIEDYFAAKLRLFTDLLPSGSPAVVNADGAFADRVIAAAQARGQRLITTGRAGTTLQLLAREADGFRQRLTLRVAGEATSCAVTLPLVGDFQVENALVAAGLAIALGEEPREAVAALASLQGVPGRLERVGEVNGALTVVDYAHKPEALAHVLDSLRPFASGKLVCVFGCGGDRDRGKRPIMGAIAAERADIVIVTDDNPRSEDPASIRAAILAAAPNAREIGDRAEAIRTAIGALDSGDVLVVAGKGHETGQIIGERTLPFSDYDVVRAALAEFAR
jgi:UDP-N-acetylmuramoyl-L-alanyl-D-glutamate--2,6-diaminopimelate ligase